VIEQAKGIIMAQHRCGPEEAFDLLRRASQRTNVKVRELAAQIIEHIASSDNHGNVVPIRLGAAPGRWGGDSKDRNGAKLIFATDEAAQLRRQPAAGSRGR
jgi:hypothetical protein